MFFFAVLGPCHVVFPLYFYYLEVLGSQLFICSCIYQDSHNLALKTSSNLSSPHGRGPHIICGGVHESNPNPSPPVSLRIWILLSWGSFQPGMLEQVLEFFGPAWTAGTGISWFASGVRAGNASPYLDTAGGQYNGIRRWVEKKEAPRPPLVTRLFIRGV